MFAKKGAAIIGSFLSEGALEDNFFSIDLKLLIVKRLYVMHSVFRGPGLCSVSKVDIDRLAFEPMSQFPSAIGWRKKNVTAIIIKQQFGFPISTA